ncbi:MAG: hypothetical protein JO368_06950, partial [Acidimicrobiales bacterium]|nr:hypothetical protein [Acidimicrobiales bacterium]
DPDHPLVGSLVFLWVPFTADRDDEGDPETLDDVAVSPEGPTDDAKSTDPVALVDPVAPAEGKRRPCVVIGVSDDELLVRAGYSEGGRRSREWTSVALRNWRQVGLEQPTWIGADNLRLPRPDLSPPHPRLTIDDWNALW